ncbi:putative permease [Oesophagostomum dentatum]|uniref:Putative permease n=1 Tax=Oesophagostomum dentatum TaxID=61180 RepID=A0A0B1TCE5_OESDE|nr:putative permease [Oesophagostomum dentatum]
MGSGKIDNRSEEPPLHFTVNQVPGIGSLILFGFQQMMISMSALLVVPFLQSNVVCAGSATTALRVRLIAASFFISGIATILQTTLGLRLCILHGPSYSFLPPLFAFATMPENECSANMTTVVPEEEWRSRLLTIQGSLAVSVLTIIALGASGLVGHFAKLVGPITYLIATGFSWLVCYLLTVSDIEPRGGEARTDKNHTVAVLKESPWFQVPYPGQFGLPQVSFGLMLGFLASCAACTMESIGDYQACARVVSRSTMQVTGVFLIFAGLFTKCAAVLASIPDAVVGGVLGMGLAMITGVAISNLQKVDLKLTRNTTIMGMAILLGALVPYHFEHNRVNFGIKSIDDCLNMLLSIRMLIAGITAFILDNTVSGATREQRGFVLKDADEELRKEEDGYAFPPSIRTYVNW